MNRRPTAIKWCCQPVAEVELKNGFKDVVGLIDFVLKQIYFAVFVQAFVSGKINLSLFILYVVFLWHAHNYKVRFFPLYKTMKRTLGLGDGYALTKHKRKQYTIRYLSLLAVLTSMCLYAVKQASAQQA